MTKALSGSVDLDFFTRTVVNVNYNLETRFMDVLGSNDRRDTFVIAESQLNCMKMSVSLPHPRSRLPIPPLFLLYLWLKMFLIYPYLPKSIYTRACKASIKGFPAGLLLTTRVGVGW